ncbi:uncharacterized protein IL334_000062 [Kwoniella shivajii]|uniref:SUN domain-containing protein n=1 Tax=Kwoniella shivajii TaxID=564305 RepID=A0ABZ1CN39_9TREE|nr:hypothetical protein IL334_000062 [Kwoniella shivajii]
MSQSQLRLNNRPISKFNSQYSPSSSSSPFLSHQTITFLASWRGQLLVCTIVLLLGAIYFFVRPPIDQWHQRRKEALSRKRQTELMKMTEKDHSQDEKDDSTKDAKGKNEKKNQNQGRKRINSHLKPIPTSEAQTSTLAIADSTSPLISTITSKVSSNTLSTPSVKKKKSFTTNAPNSKSRKPDQSNPTPVPTPTRHKPPPPIIVPQSCTARREMNPWEIPLPSSPVAGPSRLNGSNHTQHTTMAGLGIEEISDDGSLASAGEGDINKDKEEQDKKKSEGFSIYPEEGYLPVQTPNGTNKKKKKKAKTPQFTNGTISTTSSSVPMTNTSSREQDFSLSENHITGREKEVDAGNGIENTPSRLRHQHTRTSSISLLPNLNVGELRAMVEKRDETIDQLRAEIGMAKAEEAKAKEETVRARMGEEKIRGELEKSWRGRSDGNDRRREVELQFRLSQMQQLYTTSIARLSTCEAALRDGGILLPPLPSPIPMHIPQSPLPPMPQSPYASSPGRNTPIMGGFLPYPSPGMYPSPMLHPNPHYHSPSPYRRTSSMTNGHPNGNGHVYGNGLTEDLNMNGNGLTYPMDIGSSTMPIGLGHPVNGNNEGEGERARRRQSIESSVLKKKVQQLTATSTSKESETAGMSEPRLEEESVNGTEEEAVGTSSGSGSVLGENSNASMSTRSEAQLCVNGSTSGNSGIKVLLDSERGNIYYSEDSIPNVNVEDDEEDGEDVASEIDGERVEEEGNGNEDGNQSKDFQPIFASLAHTPEQIQEMRKLSQQARSQVKVQAQRERGRSVSSLSSAGRGTHAGLGNGGLLTPSPSKSPIPLRD